MNPENTDLKPFNAPVSKNTSKFGTEGHEISYNYWYNLPTAMHTHEHFELFIVLQGSFKHIFNGKEYLLKKGDIVLIKPTNVHRICPITKDITAAKHFNMPIKEAFFGNLTKLIDYNLLKQIEDFDGHICCNATQVEMDYLLLLLQKLTVCEKTEIQTHLRLLALSCLFMIKNTLNVSPFPEWLVAFIEKINSPQYFSYPIHQLYKLVPYSQPQLSLLFKKYLNTTLISYVTNTKIEYACSLLAHKDLSILQISELSGFKSLSNFNHIFKKLKGCSPTEYKEQLKITSMQ